MEPSNNGRRRSIRNLRRSSTNFQVPTNLFEEENKENASKPSTLGSLWVQEEESTSDKWSNICEGEPHRETDSSTNNQIVHECSGFLADIPDNTVVWPNLDEFDKADISITQDSDSIPISRAVSASPCQYGSPRIHINMVDSAKESPAPSYLQDSQSASEFFIGSTEDLVDQNRDLLSRTFSSESLAKSDSNICFNQAMFSLSDEETSFSLHTEIDNIVNTTYVIDEEPTVFTDNVQSLQNVIKVQSSCIDDTSFRTHSSIGSVPTIIKPIISSDNLEKEQEIVGKNAQDSLISSESEVQTSSSSSSCSSIAPTKPSQKTDLKNKKTSKNNKRLSLNKKVSEKSIVNNINSSNSQETLSVSHNNVNGLVGDLEWLSMTEITNSCKKMRAKLCDKKKRYSAKLFMDNLESNLTAEEDIWDFDIPKLTSNFNTVQQQVIQPTRQDIQCQEKQTDLSNGVSLGDSVNHKTNESLIEKKKRRRSSNLFRPHSDFSKQTSENINNNDNIFQFQSLSLHVPEHENNSSKSIGTNGLCSEDKHDDFDCCSVQDEGNEFAKQMTPQSSKGILETEPDLIVNTLSLRFCEEVGEPKLSTMDILSVEEIDTQNDDNVEELFNLSSMKNIKRPSRTKANRKSWNLYQSGNDDTAKKEKKTKGVKKDKKKKEVIEIKKKFSAEDTLPSTPPPAADLDQTPSISASNSPEVQINEELENLYRNKNYELPAVFKQWQTIKENPTAPRTFFSKNHFFRYLDFQNAYRPTPCKLTQRHSRAVKFMRGKQKIKHISEKRFDKKMSELKTFLDSP